MRGLWLGLAGAAGLMGAIKRSRRLDLLCRRLVSALCAWSCGAAMAAGLPADEATAAARGRLLYETGADADGRPMRAARADGTPVSRSAVACVNCHRPSTIGGIEGGLLVPPIAGHVLFAPGKPPSTQMNMRWMRHQTRSAYDSAKFARAVTAGQDPDGQRLGAGMPLYALDTRQLADLEAYLRARGREPVPGLKDGVLHVATVFAPDAPEARRHAVRQVMQAWSEQLRFGPVRVVWHPWTLQGAPAQWAEQLRALQARQPVFGLVSGAGGAHWQPVQDFCEQQRIACAFPSLDRLPEGATPPRFATYFSAGVDGEARMLASVLRGAKPAPAEVLQVWQGDAGAGAAQTLKTALQHTPLRTRSVNWTGAVAKGPNSPNGPPSAAVVLWLSAPDAAAWLAAHRPGSVGRVYLSAQLAPAQAVKVPVAWQGQVQWLSMRAAPADFYGGLAFVLEPWAQAVAARGDLSPVEFADARAAAFLFGDAVGLCQGVLRPDYLIERLETSVKDRAAAGIYVQASLGPAQRVASVGGHLLAFQRGRPDVLVRASPYLRAGP